MTRRLAVMCLIAVFLIGAGPARILAQGGGATRTELKGINAVYVVIEELSDAAKSFGLEARDIQTDVELKLLLGGMHVVKREEGQKLPGRPFIYVRITLTKSASAGYVAIELNEDAQLERNDQRASAITTWETGTISGRPTVDDIRGMVKDDVGIFLNDWHAANPTK